MSSQIDIFVIKHHVKSRYIKSYPRTTNDPYYYVNLYSDDYQKLFNKPLNIGQIYTHSKHIKSKLDKLEDSDTYVCISVD
jgi:hypothetical protein